MVRKWSYLNSHSVSPDFDTLARVSSFYNFKVFRKTTRFKRFNRGLTRMVRRNYARRKHQSNHIVLSYITRYWALHYLQARQFERFYSSLGRFQISAFSSHVDVFHVRISELSHRNGINVLSCSRPILNKHINYSVGAAFLRNPTSHTNPTMVQVLSPTDLIQSSEVYPNVINFENSLYCPVSVEQTLSTEATQIQMLQNLDNALFNSTNQFALPLYQVLIHLTLLNVNRPH